jgi:predicted transcriptional regulator
MVLKELRWREYVREFLSKNIKQKSLYPLAFADRCDILLSNLSFLIVGGAKERRLSTERRLNVG